jgi:hypothetical protein
MSTSNKSVMPTGEALRTFQSLTDEELGRYIREYIIESDHNDWDGWSPREKSICRKVVRDMAIGMYHWGPLQEV